MRKLSFGKMACVVLVFCATTAIVSQAQTFTTLISFDRTNGFNPSFDPSLVQGFDGEFYGTTTGSYLSSYPPDCSENGCGTIFKITAGGTLTMLHSFSGNDGEYPSGGLLQATDGSFYGTTVFGGTSDACVLFGCGTVFNITPLGTLTTLHSFDRTDGDGPHGPLIQATDGNFYGTTESGGLDYYGTVFKITSAGALTTLNSVGLYPEAGLVQGTDGNFYGTAGGIFKITPGGTLTTLHSFDGTDGFPPFGPLVQGPDGNFYGTTAYGGTHTCTLPRGGCGVIFKITPWGAFTTLHSFDGTDGLGPGGALAQATDGNFYGTTVGGGAYGYGTVFKMTPGGTLTTLHSFDGTDGQDPEGLLQATNGTFYGTTYAGGADNTCGSLPSGCGTVFSLSVGLGPFVQTVPTSGKVGATVIILGNNLTAAAGVSFNGRAAAFTAVSSTEITTTVPAGATTGTVDVSTPTGTLNSNPTFWVLSPWILKNSSQIHEYSSSRRHSCAAMNVTAGDLLLSYNIVYNSSTSGLTLTNSDTQGNTWTVIQTATIPRFQATILQIQYARAKSSGSDAIMVSVPSNVENLGNGCEEWSGGAASGLILDVSAGAKSSTTSTAASASAVTTGSNDLVVGFCAFPWDSGYSSYAMGAGAGYTQDVFNKFLQATSVFQAAAGPGNQTASCMTSGPASNWAAIIAAFLSGSGT